MIAKLRHMTPLILFHDSFRARVTGSVLRLYSSDKIDTIAMPAHTIDRQQPLELSLFQPLTKVFMIILKKYRMRGNEIIVTVVS